MVNTGATASFYPEGNGILGTTGHSEAAISTRLAAGLIDAAIVAILGGVAAKGALALLKAGGFEDALTQPVYQLVLLAVFLGYFVLLTGGRCQGTLGQLWLGLRVLGAKGGQPTAGESLCRCLALLAAVLPLGAGLLIGLGSERRPFQDWLCHSRVVRRENNQISGPA
jgi:uncharacterized RDD family membrane protein YckC